MASFDSILEVAIPILLVAIVLGFIWVKFLKPFALPMLADFWDWINNAEKEKKQKEITYS